MTDFQFAHDAAAKIMALDCEDNQDAINQIAHEATRKLVDVMLDRSGKPHFPLIGETWQCVDDGFSGVVTDITYSVDGNGGRSMSLRLVNYNTSLYGTGAN